MSPAAAALAVSVTVRVGGLFASGVLWNPARGEVLTCSHVFDGAPQTPWVELASGRREAARIVARDGDADLALLAIGPRAGRAPVLGSTAVVEAGRPVALAGCPDGRCFTAAVGRLTGALRVLFDLHLLQLRAPVAPGDSGGPVVDAEGRLIGLVAYRDLVSPGLGYLVPIEAIRAHLARLAGAARAPWASRYSAP